MNILGRENPPRGLPPDEDCDQCGESMKQLHHSYPSSLLLRQAYFCTEACYDAWRANLVATALEEDGEKRKQMMAEIHSKRRDSDG